MLINFSVENYRSIKDEVVFTMKAASKQSDALPDNHIVLGEVNLLKSAVMFGANASGKSSVISAMSTMRKMVEGEKFSLQPFKFDVDFIEKPTTFKVEFLCVDTIYKYGFSVKDKTIVKEWLFCKKNKPRSKETQLFRRSYQEFENFGDFQKEADLIKKSDITKDSKLYLSVVSEFNGQISKQIVGWFEIFNTTSSVNNNLFHYTLKKVENDSQRKRVVDLMRSVDFGIADLFLNTVKPVDIIGRDNISGYIQNTEDIEVEQINTHHHQYQDKKFVGFESLPMAEESYGTRQLFEKSGAIIEALDKGEVLVIDEMDNGFHTQMTKAIIKLFNSDKNTKNAQLIFASHNTNILTQDVFRRDQIWMVEKDIYGSTQLYSIAEIKGIRKDAKLEKGYLAGEYGAMPFITDLDYHNGEER
ncbi:hypothetical protein THERMOT_2279 [Bathymodiolus thermophilus thioautotrophic gill symbiont]|uniref:AAA family ATPase n=1 Tax=Bathymodiolus thermophilus thioautotrophic gill symbiont TaxID=2360 RepID=UPI00192A89F2|nr:ATP-binding protein [Bathymodiolus thermophilus thioautotrophic gill symbiont]CAB5506140.1 hypothetical protein THERMOT_2279 [Bathymodiolus thermophilus thioautotrophic gill symbiont]